MPIGTSDGETYDTHLAYLMAQPRIDVYKDKPNTQDNNVITPPATADQNVLTPKGLEGNKEFSQDPESTLDIGFKRPTGGPTEPAGAFKSEQASTLASEASRKDLPNIEDVPHHDWVENLLGGMAQAVKSGLTVPGDVFSGKRPAGSQSEIEGATDLAATIVGSPTTRGANTLGTGGIVSPAQAFKQGVAEAHNMWVNKAQEIIEKFKQEAKSPIRKEPSFTYPSDYNTPAWKGLRLHEGQEISSKYDFEKGHPEIYSSNSALLADMYTSYLSRHPAAEGLGKHVPEETFVSGSTVMPLLINTKNYHVHDAKGKTWIFEQPTAINEAKAKGAPGVVMHNVWDEPNNTRVLKEPKTVYITFPEGAGTVKSRFAKKFD